MSEYVYFVSFSAYRDGGFVTGNIEITTTTKIASINDVHFTETEIQSRKKLINVVITNFILLRTE
jgi:hypothetical protein